MLAQFGGRTNVTVQPGFTYATAPALKTSRLVVADLTPVHQANTAYQSAARPGYAFSGHHSDIFLPEIYNLMLAFWFKP